MEFSYYEFNGKFIDFQVVETGFWFTWIRLKYELYDDNGNVIDVDWTDDRFGTFGYEPEFEDDDYDEDGEIKLTEEEIINYVDDLFHDSYEIEELIEGITRASYPGTGCYEEIKSVEDICKQLFEVFHILNQRHREQ